MRRCEVRHDPQAPTRRCGATPTRPGSRSPGAQAVDLVEFTFGNGAGTTTAQAVATHLAATPVAGRKSDGSVAPHTFVDLGGGNMAMQLLNSEGGYKFDFRSRPRRTAR